MRGMNVVTRWGGGEGGGSRGGGGGGSGHAGERRPRGNRGVGEAHGARALGGWRRPVHYATTRLYPPPAPLWYNGEAGFSVAPENRRKVQSGTPVVNESTEQSEKPSIK